MKYWRCHLVLGSLAAAPWLGAADPPSAATPADEDQAPSAEEVLAAGKSLFDQYAPPEVKQQFDFPTKAQWDEFAARLQQALDQNDLRALAVYEPQARAALVALRGLPGYEDYADWLQERLDYIEAAKQTAQQPPPRPPPLRPAKPGEKPAPSLFVPYYDLWVQRMQARATPPNASALMPALRAAFAREGVPPEIAWLAEAESTLNPSARSPAGAKGLFQFTPDTAKGLGLSTFLPDDRTDPEKSARAAGRYLRSLYARFGEWPLAFAAYNAGEGRVSRLLKQRGASTFAGIASSLPSETRMYVPKVCATIAVRAGVPPEKLPPPRT